MEEAGEREVDKAGRRQEGGRKEDEVKEEEGGMEKKEGIGRETGR